MSATLAYGNIFEVVAEYERYVDYRVTDPTLNGWNYEPIYAVRWVEATEIALAPPHSFIDLRLPGPSTPKGIDLIPSLQLTTSTTSVEPPVQFVDTPEPGYGLILGLAFLAIYIRMTRVCRPAQR
jgi:hypothetical protein